jgi:Domain of unknown function (DUF5664)
MSEGLNPKDLIGSTKVDLALVPPSAIIAEALAMTDGGLKYGPFNWRERGKPVQARTYVSAALRHIAKWFDGEEIDPESGAPHLGHARACLGILIDAAQCGNMLDNRPFAGHSPAMLKAGESVVKKLTEAAKAPRAK